MRCVYCALRRLRNQPGRAYGSDMRLYIVTHDKLYQATR